MNNSNSYVFLELLKKVTMLFFAAVKMQNSAFSEDDIIIKNNQVNLFLYISKKQR